MWFLIYFASIIFTLGIFYLVGIVELLLVAIILCAIGIFIGIIVKLALEGVLRHKDGAIIIILLLIICSMPALLLGFFVEEIIVNNFAFRLLLCLAALCFSILSVFIQLRRKNTIVKK